MSGWNRTCDCACLSEALPCASCTLTRLPICSGMHGGESCFATQAAARLFRFYSLIADRTTSTQGALQPDVSASLFDPNSPLPTLEDFAVRPIPARCRHDVLRGTSHFCRQKLRRTTSGGAAPRHRRGSLIEGRDDSRRQRRKADCRRHRHSRRPDRRGRLISRRQGRLDPRLPQSRPRAGVH